MVRREIPRYAGIYINGQIQGVDVTFTVDKGATTTILAYRVYQKIQPDERPSLQVLNPRMDLVGADGSSLVGKGMATFEIRLGPLRLRRKLAVAEISDEALLGADILQSDEVGPADLLLTENKMVLGNTSIPVKQVKVPKTERYARIADHYVIPGMSQMFVEVFVDSPAQQDSSNHLVLLETNPSLIEDYSVLLAPTVIDTKDRATGSIIIMNPLADPVSIKQDQVVACIEEIDGEDNVLMGRDMGSDVCRNEREGTGCKEVTVTAGSNETSCTVNPNCDSVMATNSTRPLNEGTYVVHKGTQEDDCVGTHCAVAESLWTQSTLTNKREREVVGSTSLIFDPAAEPISWESEEPPSCCRETAVGDHTPCLRDSVRREVIVIRRQLVSDLPDEEIPTHMHDLYERSTTHKTEEEKAAIRALLIRFQHMFSKDDNDLGRTHLIEHEIDTGDTKPVKLPPRRMPLAFAGEDLTALQKLKAQGTIRPSSSPWVAPLVLVHKKDGSVRPCVDYRRLNFSTCKDAFPIPRTQDCLDALEGAKLFSTLDITSAYNQIPVREEDIAKTAFISKYALYEFTTMPFGLCNAAATFQRLMEVALCGLQWVTCLIYLDDVIIYGSNFAEHINRLETVLDRIAQAGLKLKPRKCHFFQEEVTFLGHLVSGAGVLPHPDDIQKLLDWPVPSNDTEVRGILGLGNYYRRFVRDFSKLVHPLTELNKKDKAFIWTDSCQEAFVHLKQAFVSPSIMAFPSDAGQFILDTDASDRTIGAVLSQSQSGVERVIAYGSHALNKAERNYCVTDRELLAVKYFMMQYKHYLLGRHFLVQSDHQALRWLFSLKEPKSRIARWIELLSAFDFEVEYRPGKKHGNADVLSRCPNPRQCQCEEDPRILKCGPCQKCERRSEQMMSSLTSEGTVRRVRTTCFTSRFSQRVSSTWKFVVGLVIMVVMLAWLPGAEGCDWGSAALPVGRVARLSRGSLSSQFHGTWPTTYDSTKMRTMKLLDDDIGPVMRWLEQGPRPFGKEVCQSSPATRHYWNLWASLKIRDGMLFREFIRRDGTGKHLQLVLPTKLKGEVLSQIHDSKLGGHLGKKKTCEKLVQRFY